MGKGLYVYELSSIIMRIGRKNQKTSKEEYSMASLWSGRFEKEMDEIVKVFNASIGFDQ